jgi:hypothetical protein
LWDIKWTGIEKKEEEIEISFGQPRVVVVSVLWTRCGPDST